MPEESNDKEKDLAEKKATDEATEKYNELIADLILIATSSRSKREKLSLINEKKAKMLKFNDSFSTNQTEQVYKKFAGKAADEAMNLIEEISIKKKLLPGQEAELQNLSDQLKSVLNKRLDVLIDQARELTLKEELAKIRESKLGMTDGSEKIQITAKRSRPNLVFVNGDGKVVRMDAVMSFTVGDNIWTTITSSQRSQWLLMGFRYVTHISVMDTKTTIICRSLNKTRRDLTKDQLPPMHIRCRSGVKLSKEGWNRETFFKNYRK